MAITAPKNRNLSQLDIHERVPFLINRDNEV